MSALSTTHARPAVVGAVTDGPRQFGQRQVALVGRAREPFRRDAADPLAATDIHFVAAAGVAAGL